ncbi:MAG TPA: hypothetical protein HA306_02520 [Methanosarcina sp.]|nr:hypothetical protein [Methanosarcina sp.]
MEIDKQDMEQISNSKARKETEKLQRKASSGDKAAKRTLEKEKKRK